MAPHTPRSPLLTLLAASCGSQPIRSTVSAQNNCNYYDVTTKAPCWQPTYSNAATDLLNAKRTASMVRQLALVC